VRLFIITDNALIQFTATFLRVVIWIGLKDREESYETRIDRRYRVARRVAIHRARWH
jgi:hypothetical protein